MDAETLKCLLVEKQRRADEARRAANEAEQDKAALKRVLAMLGESDSGEVTEAPPLAKTQSDKTANAAEISAHREGRTLYPGGKRPLRRRPPREGSIASQAIEFIIHQHNGQPQDVETVAAHLDVLRGEPVDRRSIDRILRREVREGTLQNFGPGRFGGPEGPMQPGKSVELQGFLGN